MNLQKRDNQIFQDNQKNQDDQYNQNNQNTQYKEDNQYNQDKQITQNNQDTQDTQDKQIIQDNQGNIKKETKKQNMISLDDNAYLLLKKLKQTYKDKQKRNYTYSDVLRELIVTRKKYNEGDKSTDEIISKINREIDLMYNDINVIKNKVRLIINERR